MKYHTFTVLLGIFCHVTADFHLPDEEGFLPGFLPMLPFPLAPQILPPPTPVFQRLKERNGDQLFRINNLQFEMYKQALLTMLPQLNQLCAILKNCNPIVANQNSQAYQMGYDVAALPASTPTPATMLANPSPTNYYAPAPPSPVTQSYNNPALPPYPATLPTVPASMPGFAVPAPPSFSTKIPIAVSPIPGFATLLSYPATTPRTPVPVPSYGPPAPQSYPLTISGAPLPVSASTTPSPYPATSPRVPAYVPASLPSYSAPTQQPYSETTTRPSASVLNAPASPSYPATTPGASTSLNYPSAPVVPYRRYPITISSTY